MAPDVANEPTRLRELADGYKVSRAIYAIVELGIPDLLGEGARTAEALAEASGAHAGSLRRVLRFLASHGLFEEMPPDRFALTALADPLRGGAFGSERERVLMNGSDWCFEPWRALPRALRDGGTAFRHVYGRPFFEQLDRDPEARALFDRAMAATTSQDVGALVEAYDFSRFATVVDVGGGEGPLTRALLERHPSLRAVLVDSDAAAARAEARLSEAGLGDRVEVARGDFFESLPEGGDAYLLKDILHDWTDEEAARLLGRCHEAMRGRGVLLVLERLADDDRAREVLSVDVTMLVLTGGRERTASEYASLLRESGFDLSRVVATRSVTSVLEARPR